MLKRILYILLLLLSIISIFLGFNATIIPNIILYVIVIIYLIILSLILLLVSRKRQIFRIIGYLFTLILVLNNITLIFIYQKVDNFFSKINNVEYETSNYLVIVFSDSKFNNLDDITSIGLFHNQMDTFYQGSVTKLNLKQDLRKYEYGNILALVTDFLNKKIDAIFINQNYIDIINEETYCFNDRIRIIDEISIKANVNQKNDSFKTADKINSFNIYISGIDTYGPINTVSRSDVNMIATVNINENKILLTNTPRDYYIQLHGTTGTKDKLTHAGVYGINMSIQTLEDLYGIKIDYYVRVNFNSLITLVDAIGGVDIYSDTEFGSGKYHVNYGWNHFDGEQALSYSRQRMIYLDGDRHRGRNQQQVIEAIIKKVTESKDINTYLGLLDTLSDSFQTNIDKKTINGVINLQVKNNYNWTVETSEVTGYDDGGYTYSYPGQVLYVMQPDYNSLEVAKNKIKALLD